VPKRRITIIIFADVAFNVERKNLGTGGDGSDVQLGFDKGSNMRSKIFSHFIKGKIGLSLGNNFNNTWRT
jgi:hypothetical protein